MIPIPDWAPNIHPLVIHFPIALLVVAVFCDAVAVLFQGKRSFRSTAVLLFALGAFAALAAYRTGGAAVELVSIPAAAQAVLTEHEDWAERTVWFFGLFALLRLALLWFNGKGMAWAGEWTHRVVFLMGAAGLYLLIQTGDRGGRLVFQHGIGVQSPAIESQHEPNADPGGEQVINPSSTGEAVISPVRSANGSWLWEASVSAKRRGGPGQEFRFLAGNLAALQPVLDDSVLTIVLDGSPALFVIDPAIASIQADVRMNTDRFDGSVGLVHHVQDLMTYDFLRLEDGAIRLGRVSESGTKFFDEKRASSSGWFTLRVISDKDHYRGYVDGTLRVHGHGSEPDAGPVGLFFEGNGVVEIDRIEVQSLR